MNGPVARNRSPANASAGLSTHVLDNARGEPASGVAVRLERRESVGWTEVARGRTDSDGRLRDWVPSAQWGSGDYRLIFDTAGYLGTEAFFPEAVVVFRVAEPRRHLHIPLLLSPFGYCTYRGS
jgi:5-hydroxyisourate hydrolase